MGRAGGAMLWALAVAAAAGCAAPERTPLDDPVPRAAPHPCPLGVTTPAPAAVQPGAAPPRPESRTPALAAYYARVAEEMRWHWIVPEWVARCDVSVPVEVTIARDGRLLAFAIEGTSGNAALDGTIRAALERAQQRGRPPLPAEHPYAELVLVLEFNPTLRR